jgi:metallo-beta-lactamase family protein
MCEAGRIRHHLKHNLWRPESTVLFVGYQSPGTVGAKLLEGAEFVRLFGEDIQVRSEIRQVDSFSSHADKKHLLEWIGKVDPSTQVFINHGENEVTESFAMEAAKLTGKPAVAPYSGEVWDLAECSLVHKAEIVPVIRKSAQAGSTQESSGKGYKVTESTARAASAYSDLRATGEKLMQLIDRCQGRSNKHLRAFASEIEALIKKWK